MATNSLTTQAHAALEPASDVVEVSFGGETYFACFAVVGEAEAANILANYNGQNRHRNNSKVLDYAESMRTKTWGFNGASIVFSLDPITLLDGQHRLEAIVVTKTSQLFLVAWGVPFGRFTTIDTGLLRKLRQALQTNGRDFANVRAQVVTHLYRYERNLLGEKTSGAPSIDDGLAVHQTYQVDIDAAIRFVTGIGNWRCGRALSKDLAALMYIFMARKSPKVAAHYLGTVIRNEGPDGSAVPLVVAKLNTIALSGNKTGTMLRDKVAALCTGWNSFVKGSLVSNLKAGGSKGSQSACKWMTDLRKPIGKVEDASEEWLTKVVDEVSARADYAKKRHAQHWTNRSQDPQGLHSKDLRTKLRDRVAARRANRANAQEVPEA